MKPNFYSPDSISLKRTNLFREIYQTLRFHTYVFPPPLGLRSSWIKVPRFMFLGGYDFDNDTAFTSTKFAFNTICECSVIKTIRKERQKRRERESHDLVVKE